MAPRVSLPQFYRLCETLWSWHPCDKRRDLRNCTECASRIARLTPFLRHYNDTISVAYLDLEAQAPEVQLTHETILSVVVLLKKGSKNTRTEIRQQLQGGLQGNLHLNDFACDVLLNAALKIMTMVDCTSENISLRLLEHGVKQVSWHNDASMEEFIDKVFPQQDDGHVHNIRDAYCGLSSGRMTARKLVKHAKIVLRPTSDIRAHLRYNRAMNSLEIFHHTAFLKEQLRATRGMNLGTSASFERPTLPRQLLLEILDSIQKILFPLDDTKSHALLRSFIAKYSLDPDCLRFESTEIREDHELLPSYRYIGSRIMDLYEVALNPRPQRRFEKSLERRSGARYIMLATIAGVMFAILLGIASLAVSILQTYITYQAWKHPVQVAG